MNYQKIYDDICKRGQERVLPKEVYTEKHHIIPKCLGGGNEKTNITKLTAKEHFICHLILARKLYTNNFKIWSALHKMMHSSNEFQKRYIPSGKIYEMLRIEVNNRLAEIGHYNRGKTWEELYGLEKAKQMKVDAADRSRGRIWSEESREKCRRINLGRKFSDETKKLIGKYSSERQQGESNVMFGKKHSEKSKKQMSLNSRKSMKDVNEIDFSHLNFSNNACIKVTDPETGQIFNSMKSAALYYNVTQNCITRWVRCGWLLKIT